MPIHTSIGVRSDGHICPEGRDDACKLAILDTHLYMWFRYFPFHDGRVRTLKSAARGGGGGLIPIDVQRCGEMRNTSMAGAYLNTTPLAPGTSNTTSVAFSRLATAPSMHGTLQWAIKSAMSS